MQAHKMEPAQKVRKYTEEEIFYSDPEDEQDLSVTLRAVGKVRTVFRLGHTLGTEHTVTQLLDTGKVDTENTETARALSDDMSRDLTLARTQSRYVQR